VHNVSDVRQIEEHRAELLVPSPSRLEVGTVIAKLKNHKSPGSDPVAGALIQAGVKHYCLRSINSLILFVIRKNCLISGRSLLLCQFSRKAMKLIATVIVGYHCYQLHAKCYPISFSQGKKPTLMKLLRIISVGFDVTDNLLSRFSAFVRYWRKNGSTMRQYISL
jgi:hypothetical protein